MHQIASLPRGFQHSVAEHAHALVGEHVGKRLDFPRFVALHDHTHKPRAEHAALALLPLEFRDEVDVGRGYPLFLGRSRVDGADDAQTEATCDGVGGFAVRIGGEEFDSTVDEALLGNVECVDKSDLAHAVRPFAALVAAVEEGEVLRSLVVAQPILDEAVETALVHHLDIIDMTVFLNWDSARKRLLGGRACRVWAGRTCRGHGGREDDCDRTSSLCRTEE